MEIQKIKVRDEQLSVIVHDIERGLLRLPPFQRDFVWERAKVVKLLDSIYHEFPIGTFFIWEADRKYNAFYRNIAELEIPDPEPHADVHYILDGQQRITSLFVTAKGLKINQTDYSQICFDFDKERFLVRYKEGDYYAPLKDILGENHLQVYNRLNDDRKKTFEKCRRIFISYPLSVVSVREKDLGEAAVIFERINQGGKRLTLFPLKKKLQRLCSWQNEQNGIRDFLFFSLPVFRFRKKNKSDGRQQRQQGAVPVPSFQARLDFGGKKRQHGRQGCDHKDQAGNNEYPEEDFLDQGDRGLIHFPVKIVKTRLQNGRSG